MTTAQQTQRRSTPPPFPAMSDRRIVSERETAAPDSDTATAQTVRRMCEYIQQGVNDPGCQQLAARALRNYGRRDFSDALSKCWAVWWLVKHSIKYRSDEATMFRIGEQGQQDLLIAPAVLVRMKDPAEDCDGFTMLVATLLKILGVDVVIATVAVDPSDPSRWSHVFCCALLPDGTVLPLDASHGSRPGWMVPKEHTFRFQAWDCNGSPVDVQPSQHQGLHGYFSLASAAGMGSGRRRGMGDFSDYSDLGPGDSFDGTTVPGLTSVAGAVPSSGGSSSLTTFLEGLANSGVSLATKILTPPTFQQSTSTNAQGQVTNTTIRSATPSTALSAAAGLGTMNPTTMLLIGGGLLALVLISTSKK